MIHPRLIPCLLVQNRGLVKTRKFADPKYVGDPINAVRIFNEKCVDELMVLDIDASVTKRGPDYKLIESLASECSMPLCYGGGIKTLEHVESIIGLGVEKVAMSSVLFSEPRLLSEVAERLGAQSVVVVLDIKKTGITRKYEVVTHNGAVRTGHDPFTLIAELSARGVGEVVVNSVDRDGMLNGYDLDLISRLRKQTNLPMTFIGGVGKLEDVGDLWRLEGLVGASAGSLFVFKGRYRAVLINYPNPSEKNALMKSTGRFL